MLATIHGSLTQFKELRSSWKTTSQLVFEHILSTGARYKPKILRSPMPSNFGLGLPQLLF